MKHNGYSMPDENGYFGEFGGMFAPAPLKDALLELKTTYMRLRNEPGFIAALSSMYRKYAGRPSILYFAENLTKAAGGAKIYLKREDLNHTGAHKINNCIGQGLVAKRMGKKKLIAETGAGQHGTATATIAAYFGMKCDIYMGERDMKAQKPNVYRMKILGANVIPVTQGQGTLKDAVDAAFAAYVKEPDSYYLLGSAVGPHPYPVMVRDFQKIIGQEARKQILEREGTLPAAVIACVGGGSNAMGVFSAFLQDRAVKLIAVEPAGLGKTTGKHGMSLGKGTPALIHGFKTLVLQDENGNVKESYSAASGLDYPGVGPELSYLFRKKRLEAASATDREAVRAFRLLSETEGIIPALESAHAISYACGFAGTLSPAHSIIVNLSGRGDKDVENLYETYMR